MKSCLRFKVREKQSKSKWGTWRVWGTKGAAEHPCEQVQALGAWCWHLEMQEMMCNAVMQSLPSEVLPVCRIQDSPSSMDPTEHYLPLCRINSLLCICFTQNCWNKMVSSPTCCLTNSKDGQKVQFRKYFENPGWKMCSLMSTMSYLPSTLYQKAVLKSSSLHKWIWIADKCMKISASSIVFAIFSACRFLHAKVSST